ncbi:MAG: beta-lactamase, partial [Bacteroidetes bacterium]|nr:beta-lactamase [Bacteroidota bacterium]
MKNLLSLPLLWGLFTVSSFAQNNQSLREKIDRLIPEKNYAIGIAIGGPDDRDTLTYGGNASFPIESALPFQVSLAIMDRIDKGMMKSGDKIPMVGFIDGTSSKNNDAPTLKELITSLLQTGDQRITEILIRHLGGTKELSRFLKSSGVRDVMIVTAEKDRRQDSLRIYTHTPLSAIQLLRKFHDKNLLSEKSQQFLLSLLNSNPSEKSIASSLPAGSKTIEIANCSSQVMGLISLPDGRTCTMAIFIADSIMTDGLKEKMVSSVAKATWDFYAEKAMENFRLQYDYTAAIDSLLKVQQIKTNT